MNNLYDKNIKYKIGDIVKIDNIEIDIFNVGEILNINNDMIVPNYNILTFNEKKLKNVNIWINYDEIIRKANSKEKQTFKNKKQK